MRARRGYYMGFNLAGWFYALMLALQKKRRGLDSTTRKWSVFKGTVSRDFRPLFLKLKHST